MLWPAGGWLVFDKWRNTNFGKRRFRHFDRDCAARHFGSDVLYFDREQRHTGSLDRRELDGQSTADDY